MSKTRTTDISQAQLSSIEHISRGKLNNRPKTIEDTCSECLVRGEIILRPATKLQIILLVLWGKRYLEGSEGASKKKAYIARKMS